MSESVDRTLVQQAQRGDGAAIGALFSRYWRLARAAAFGVTKEFASAEDAAAEGFKEAFTGIESLEDPDRFGSWLRTIVVRKARQGLHGRHVPIGALADEMPDQSEQPDEVLSRLEFAALLRRASRDLPDTLREAIALVYFEGYEPEIAARFIDIPPGTLRRRLHDGRVRLRATAERLLNGSKRMDEERKRDIERFKAMMDRGELYQALRGSLALRPVPSELADKFLGQIWPLPDTGFLREAAKRLLLPSDRASDPAQPTGAIAAAIRKALPHFQDWNLDAAEAAVRRVTFKSDRAGRLRNFLPPGFAEGRPGAFVRASRALVRLTESGSIEGIYELLQESPDEQTFRQSFRGAREHLRISDVLDLTWMTAAPLELRSVQELLEGLTSAVLPGVQVLFSPYDEPRYRSALQLQLGDVPARAASGGVLAPWPGQPNGVEAAHLQIFLEPWATAQSGRVVELDSLPELPNTV
jgi:RNA polymerase sigma-70 factor (ECF subfamily)